MSTPTPALLSHTTRTPEPSPIAGRVIDPQTTHGYWHHACPARDCTTWVPNHRTSCTRHEEGP